MPDKTAESVVEAYLSGILPRTGASMVCLSDNGYELKNSQMNMVLKQLGIKCIFPTVTDHKATHVSKMSIISLKGTLTKFLSSSDAEWDRILPFACYCFNTTPTADDLRESILSHPWKRSLEGCTGLLGSGNIRYLGDNKGLILFTELPKLW